MAKHKELIIRFISYFTTMKTTICERCGIEIEYRGKRKYCNKCRIAVDKEIQKEYVKKHLVPEDQRKRKPKKSLLITE